MNATKLHRKSGVWGTRIGGMAESSLQTLLAARKLAPRDDKGEAALTLEPVIREWRVS
jgi:hypothetical protein